MIHDKQVNKGEGVNVDELFDLSHVNCFQCRLFACLFQGLETN